MDQLLNLNTVMDQLLNLNTSYHLALLV
jgi:hypothetical protein